MGFKVLPDDMVFVDDERQLIQIVEVVDFY